jgi:hypothetical protein
MDFTRQAVKLSRSNFFAANSVVFSAWSVWRLCSPATRRGASRANIAKAPQLVDTASRLGARVLLDPGARCHLIVTRGHLD